MRRVLCAMLLIGLVPVAAASAQDGIRTERVSFVTGASSAMIEGELEGDEVVDYVLGASAGQTLTVTVKEKSSGSLYFNVLPPGSDNVAIWIGNSQAEPDRFSGELEQSGDYKVRFYLMGAARDEGGASFTVEFSIVD